MVYSITNGMRTSQNLSDSAEFLLNDTKLSNNGTVDDYSSTYLGLLLPKEQIILISLALLGIVILLIFVVIWKTYSIKSKPFSTEVGNDKSKTGVSDQTTERLNSVTYLSSGFKNMTDIHYGSHPLDPISLPKIASTNGVENSLLNDTQRNGTTLKGPIKLPPLKSNAGLPVIDGDNVLPKLHMIHPMIKNVPIVDIPSQYQRPLPSLHRSTLQGL